MDTGKRKLVISQLDRKFANIKTLTDLNTPVEGWIRTIRTVLKMSLRQLGTRLGISAQSVKEIEQREVDGSITIKALREAANALEMKVVYVVLPKDESIEKLIERKANELAREIVLRTSHTMLLEDQGNSDSRIEKAIKEKTEEIKNTMPKYLWDH
jgi:predicted DNA-binding mobile mystery protein A